MNTLDDTHVNALANTRPNTIVNALVSTLVSSPPHATSLSPEGWSYRYIYDARGDTRPNGISTGF